MKSLPYHDIVIVGFNGTVLGACGRALGVALHTPTERYFRLAVDDAVSELTASYRRAEIESFQKEQRITLLTKPIPAFPRAIVVYVAERFLRAFGFDRPTDFCKDFSWQEVVGQTKTWAAAASSESVEVRMNEWGRMIERRIDETLMQFLSGGTNELVAEAERMAVFGLAAARDATLRANIYLGYGAAILLSATHKRLQNIYRYVLKPQFPTWSWDDFHHAVRGHVDTLKDKAAACGPNTLATNARVAAKARRARRKTSSVQMQKIVKLTPDKLIGIVKSNVVVQYNIYNVGNVYEPQTTFPKPASYAALTNPQRQAIQRFTRN